MDGYSFCPDHNKWLPLEEFYKTEGTSDGVGTYCISHAKARAALQRKKGSQLPQSDLDTLRDLNRQGIPLYRGQDGVDQTAWGIVPVESKGAHAVNDCKLQWGFTPRQRRRPALGVVIFHAWFENHDPRVFVVPRTETNFFYPDGRPMFTALCITIDTDHPKSHWDWLKNYEGAYWIIEALRLRYSDELRRRSQ